MFDDMHRFLVSAVAGPSQSHSLRPQYTSHTHTCGAPLAPLCPLRAYTTWVDHDVRPDTNKDRMHKPEPRLLAAHETDRAHSISRRSTQPTIVKAEMSVWAEPLIFALQHKILRAFDHATQTGWRVSHCSVLRQRTQQMPLTSIATWGPWLAHSPLSIIAHDWCDID